MPMQATDSGSCPNRSCYASSHSLLRLLDCFCPSSQQPTKCERTQPHIRHHRPTIEGRQSDEDAVNQDRLCKECVALVIPSSSHIALLDMHAFSVTRSSGAVMAI